MIRIHTLEELEALQVDDAKNVAVIDCQDDVWQWRYTGWCMTGGTERCEADVVFAFHPLRVVNFSKPTEIRLNKNEVRVVLEAVKERRDKVRGALGNSAGHDKIVAAFAEVLGEEDA